MASVAMLIGGALANAQMHLWTASMPKESGMMWR